ncbi:GtrA family protein [Streptomyces antimicrobicus]|uniref:GtrA family protein n=1 Tax=Streptomyces antimicrobicus TaxID=2883108 RepID=A0ABS8B3A2_9ACTN|nr:GtrA family protein [Streptomyces antimicrobicus]MCB5179092.1 GtrA family protein [Streptomyces antimicrobicus]
MSTPEAVTLPERLRGMIREVAKFGAVGGLGVLVNLGVFNLIRSTTDLQVGRANVIAISVAIICNYIGFRYFTYRDRDKSGRKREMTLFLVFSLIGMVIETGILYTATYGFGWDSPLQSNVFKLFGIGVATLFRFWSYRTWVFRALPETSGGGVTVAGGTSEVVAEEPAPRVPAA